MLSPTFAAETFSVSRSRWAVANQCVSMLRSIYRRPCVDREGLRNPVEL